MAVLLEPVDNEFMENVSGETWRRSLRVTRPEFATFSSRGGKGKRSSASRCMSFTSVSSSGSRRSDEAAVGSGGIPQARRTVRLCL